MPKRTDIKKILIIGSGPIVIGQACEFDYSGTQACKALREEGYEIVLVNSNPATIMTDPEIANSTYIEPLTVGVLEKVISRERPQALLPTLGGQTALNLAVALVESGVVDKYGVELIGAKYEAIKKAEDRLLFKESMKKIGLGVPESYYVRSIDEAFEAYGKIGLPIIIRPSFTLGGTGGNIARTPEEFKEYIRHGLDLSPVHEVLLERSVIGWKEFELEVMRDLKDNVVIICPIENFDPMGVHTGDSITVAPAQTLTDKEYQVMRDAAIKIIREIGVETGGSNIQFAIHPQNGEMLAIEMNPRVSRSSALASKATGFPIAKIATKLAIGYTLDEIPNDITRYTPASFEPTIDYCVVKVPRFNFEKFPGADQRLTTQMKSVGEVMAIGRTFKEALGKALRSMEIDRPGLMEVTPKEAYAEKVRAHIREKLKETSWDRIWYIAEALRYDLTIEELHQLTYIDPWFLHNIKEIVDMEDRLRVVGVEDIQPLLNEAKAYGLSDARIAQLANITEEAVRSLRHKNNLRPVYKRVDTCAAEFEAHTPYLYSTYEKECEARITDRPKVVILGSGPNRIGQGIEFDYCCVHAVMALREMGYETIMVNCNPETVSTDYDTSDRLYFEPLTLEDTLEIIHLEKPLGVIVQFGGQTPLKLAVPLEREGVKVLGTSSDSIDRAEDRERFAELLRKLNLKQPENGCARSLKEAVKVAEKLGYPVLIRPSYVLGGRAMQVAFDRDLLEKYIKEASMVSPNHPVLIDKFIEEAVEIDVDAVADGQEVFVGGIMEHIEAAGIHSGDSSCALPPYSLSKENIEEIEKQTRMLALELQTSGLINIQYAIKDGEVYVLEVNPRASRTVPFVSKAIGIPLAKVATKIIMGKTLKELGLRRLEKLPYTAVKEAVLPFIKFLGVDTILGPEMKSTGEVMGLDKDFARAYAKSQMGADGSLPLTGTVFISVRDRDKPGAALLAKTLQRMGFKLMATRGTARVISREGIPVQEVFKVFERSPNVLDYLKKGEINLVINTTEGNVSHKDSFPIRQTALIYHIPYFTTLSGAKAAVGAIKAMLKEGIDVKPLQEYYSANV
ncbi:MAG TPA: carbamoyl-phosphate synthase large subunit [Candidatus Hypogeohydataceae bacterium YC41]